MLHDIKAAAKARTKILNVNVSNDDICFIAKPDTQLGLLHEANVFERSDAINKGISGVYTGAGLGLLAGLFALAFPPWYVHTNWMMIIGITTVIGAFAFAFMMAMIGGEIFNTNFEKYKTRIEQGEVMMLVKVPFYRSKEIRRIIDGIEDHLEIA